MDHEDEKEPSMCPISPASETEEQIHPMLRLQRRACILSHIEFEKAHEVDEVNLGRGLGEYTISQIAEKFHEKVLACEEAWFRDMFTSSKEEADSNLSEFLLQRFGGPSYYSERRGRPDLISRHSQFEMSPRTAEKWLELMQEALEDMDEEDVPERIRVKMMSYFRYTAYFLVAAQEGQSLMSQMGTFDQVKEVLADEAMKL